MTEWKPEETAPTETDVLVWYRGSCSIAKKWDITGSWWDDNLCILDDRPTHWMPLPEPPNEKKQ